MNIIETNIVSILLISGSLNPESHSRVMVQFAEHILEEQRAKVRYIDLRDYPLPLCDGDASYSHENVAKLKPLVKNANVILIGVPIYNYDINAAVKNLVEMTGSSWENKVVGFLCAAGGRSSYMSVMSFANSLMLDFRCLIIPRFIYAVDEDFEQKAGGEIQIKNPKILERIQELTTEATQMTKLHR